LVEEVVEHPIIQCQARYWDVTFVAASRRSRRKTMQPDMLVRKLEGLSPARLTEVEDFIDFLKSRDASRALTQAAMTASEPTLEAIWDNPEDAAYDRL
jgi:hypothetical protein